MPWLLQNLFLYLQLVAPQQLYYQTHPFGLSLFCFDYRLFDLFRLTSSLCCHYATSFLESYLLFLQYYCLLFCRIQYSQRLTNLMDPSHQMIMCGVFPQSTIIQRLLDFDYLNRHRCRGERVFLLILQQMRRSLLICLHRFPLAIYVVMSYYLSFMTFFYYHCLLL